MMKMSKMKNLRKTLTKSFASNYSFDPKRGFVFIYGEENSTTTTLGLSVVKAIPKDKKVYVLLTEPPFNTIGIIYKHYSDYTDRFVFMTEGEEPVPVMTKEDYQRFIDKYVADPDGGALIVDALDTLVTVVFSYYEPKNKFLMDAWGKTYGDLIKNLFLKVNTLGRPTVIITKEKEEAIVKRVGGELSVKKTGNVLPTVSTDRIQRWATTRLRMLDKGKYEVVKSKGKVEEGSVFTFAEDMSGTMLPQLMELMVKKERGEK